MRIFVKVLLIPPHILSVTVLLMCVIGSYALRNSVFDVYTMAIVGLIGYLLLRARIPLTPIILGLVLGETLEKEFRTAMVLSEGSYNIFYTSPAAMGFFIAALVVVALHLRASRNERMAAAMKANEQEV